MGNKEHEDSIFNIVDSMSLLRKVENCYGEIRYQVTDGKLAEPNIAMKGYGTLIPTLVVCAWTIIILDTWFNINLGTFLNSHLDDFELIDRLPMAVTMIQCFLGAVVFLRYSKANIKIINLFAYIDRLLKLNNNMDFHVKMRKNVQWAVCLFSLTLLSSIVQNFLEDQSAVIYNVLEALVDFKFHLETLSFYLYIKMISNRIDVLNKYLKHFVEKKDKIRIVTISKENIDIDKLDDYIGKINQENNAITSLAVAYETVGNTLTLINKVCSTNIFMYLVSNFFNIIISLWSFVNFIRTEKHLSSLPGIIFESVVEISVVIIMCYVCEALTTKRRATRILLNEIIMDYKLPKEMRVQAKSFMDLTDVWMLQVYASRMLCMNVQLLLSFISVSSTYLIFIIQATN